MWGTQFSLYMCSNIRRWNQEWKTYACMQLPENHLHSSTRISNKTPTASEINSQKFTHNSFPPLIFSFLLGEWRWRTNRLATEVHVCLRLRKQNWHFSDWTYPDQCLGLYRVHGDTLSSSNTIDHLKTNLPSKSRKITNEKKIQR